MRVPATQASPPWIFADFEMSRLLVGIIVISSCPHDTASGGSPPPQLSHLFLQRPHAVAQMLQLVVQALHSLGLLDQSIVLGGGVVDGLLQLGGLPGLLEELVDVALVD